ncbi:hypothetical protein [Rhodococcus sp. Leaf233]|uniref:hypothetical protein n=1 Tax=Rhodococcus sp. Leaf233 TaxID=1736302 RepID=UPI00070E7DDA|nr:hypothetical protein [Rhodococcus sp. Leaf233]KQU33580.1 hypothetical protein ASH04_07035 [Rhodococcus sp. Leaf233]
MKFDATFTKDGSDWGIELRDGLMHTYKDGEWIGGTFVGTLDPIPAAAVIDVEPELGPELPAPGEPEIEPA